MENKQLVEGLNIGDNNMDHSEACSINKATNEDVNHIPRAISENKLDLV